MSDQRSHKAWFGSKRIGWGIRPQTWQGWAIVAGIVALAVVLGWLINH